MLGWNRNGWIGVDLGERAIKVAQLRRVGDGLHLSATAMSERGRWQDSQPADDLRAANALAQHLRGSRAAATLSMSTCRIEPTSDEGTEDTGRCYDAWAAGPESAYTLSTPAERVESAVNEMTRVGLRCEVIDGPPLAIARVLQLTPGYRADELLLAIDWGETAVTVVAAKGGLAQYARRLNLGGFAEVRQQVAESLGFSGAETERLLAQLGGANNALPEDESRLVADVLRSSILPVAQEIQRSLEHLGGKLRTKPPTRCFLLGAGGAVAGLPATLGSLIGITAEPWTASGLSRDDSLADTPDCLLAQAIALSALAWEASLA